MVQAAKIGWSWLPDFWSPAASGTIVSRKAESGLGAKQKEKETERI